MSRSHTPSELAGLLRELARAEGFDLAGVCAAHPSEHADFLEEWVEGGRHGEMEYLARRDALERRREPRRSLPGARSLLVVGHNYHQPDPPGVPEDPARGVIARYARGRDYHRVVKKGLQRVHRRLEEEVAHPVGARAYVDTGPLLERELGRRAGLGWFGRNTMLLHPRTGSYFFLGVLLLELEVEPDPPFQRDHCGSCRACVDACPTGALLGRDETGAPVMDATRCISYLTIEHRGPIPRELRPLMGNRVYGCDICQEVCPFNDRFARPATEPGYAARGPGECPVGVEAVAPKASGDDGAQREGSGTRLAADGPEAPAADGPEAPAADTPEARGTSGPEAPIAGAPEALGTGALPDPEADSPPDGTDAPAHPGTDSPSLVELLEMALDPERWESFSRGSAIRRAGRGGFARSVCVALGNWLASKRQGEPSAEALDVLSAALSDPDPLVRGHAAWAMGRARGPGAHHRLALASASEPDAWVAGEVAAARAELHPRD